jgi:hexosaminidase
MNTFVIRALVFALAAGGPAVATPATDPADTYPDLHLIPWPKTLHLGTGYMRLSANSRIVAGEPQLRPLATVLSGEIALLTGLKLPVTTEPGRPGDILLRIDKTIRAAEPILMLRNRRPVRTTDGAHAIAIDRQAVVTGFDYRATAEGTSTILQLLGRDDGGFRLPRLTIHDWPHADYCGVLLDVARQDHPIAAVKKVVQLCRLYKARYLQLHLTDDQGWTFPSTHYPQLGSKNYAAHGGVPPRVYKLKELKELVADADARGVTIVPELELPGHSGAAARSLPQVFDAINPQSRQPVGIGCMNMSNEALYPALDAIIGEMCDVFKSSPYFHIGSDEVTSGRLSLHSGYKAFMERHGLKNDGELADYFVRTVCALVKKYGKEAIKWEGLANFATKDVIIMAWEGNSTFATEALARGYTTITCPWSLGVPWEAWNMYRCNASQLKRGDSVLGATLVAWEQPPATHIANLRYLPSRQERTWGPDNRVTVAGFAARFQPLDAVAGKLLQIPVKPQLAAAFQCSAGTCDFLEPAFALDGNDATFFQSAAAPKGGDHFTVTFKRPQLVYAIEVLTGVNGRGLLNGGQVQVSADGTHFTTVGRLDRGALKVLLKENRIRAVRLLAGTRQSEPMVVRAINLRLMAEVAGAVRNPQAAIGAGNVAVTKADTEFTAPIGSCAIAVINRGFTIKLNSGGNPCTYSGPISGSGTVEVSAGDQNAPLTLDGNAPNTMRGTWLVKTGRVILAKPPGVDALGGTVIVSGQGANEGLLWAGSNQVNHTAHIQVLASDKRGPSLNLNGFNDTIDRLTLAAGTKVLTDGPQGGGVLTARELWLAGKRLPRGVYTSSVSWLEGSGYVLAGDVKYVDVSGTVTDPNRTVGAGNIARLKSATALKLPEGDCSVHVVTGDFSLTLAAVGGKPRYTGVITGNGPVRIEAPGDHRPFEIAGNQTNSYRGGTTLARGVLMLSKPGNATAIPGDLTLGGSAAENKGDGVIWGADGQLRPSAVVTLQGDQPSFLDLNGHKVTLSKVALSRAARIRAGKGGGLRVRQLSVDGKRLKDGLYVAPQPWLEGTGRVAVDSRVDVAGVIGSPETQIGPGNSANLTGNTRICYPASGCFLDVITNGFTLTLDSGDGNAFACTGCISGSGNVEFFMGPSSTGFKDAPLRLGGDRPNTASGRFFAKKGRVQLEKPKGVDAISGDVIVGGQGFNDCLFWKNSDQLKDSVNITLLDAGNNGAAYLDLNGCTETAASLTMTSHNRVKTDAPEGGSGTLTVKSLTIDGLKRPAGVYTAVTETWIEGKGKVVVRLRADPEKGTGSESSRCLSHARERGLAPSLRGACPLSRSDSSNHGDGPTLGTWDVFRLPSWTVAPFHNVLGMAQWPILPSPSVSCSVTFVTKTRSPRKPNFFA